MPNWCMNTATLNHEDPEVVKEMVKKLEVMEEYTLFRTLDPEYEYREAHEVDWSESNGEITLNFDSAWSPPEELYDTLEENGWTIWATYYEPGLELAGMYIDGEMHAYDDIHSIDEDMLEDDLILKEVVDHWNIMDEIELIREWDEEE